MFEISKKFSIPVGHRLSKHKGKCKNIHGHNIDIIVTIGAEDLNENDMVMDFANLKLLVNTILDKFDHSLLLNGTTDLQLYHILKDQGIDNVQTIAFEPTAEQLARFIYSSLENKLPQNAVMHSVEIFENETSSAKYFR